MYMETLVVVVGICIHGVYMETRGYLIGEGGIYIYGMYLETRGYLYKASPFLSPFDMVSKLSEMQDKLSYLPSHFASPYNFNFKFRPVL